MNPQRFRRLALALPGSTEGRHMGHPDFRVGGRIFATLWADGETGMLKLAAEEQADLVDSDPDAFRPANGAWGRRGATLVSLSAASEARLERALELAWRGARPRRSSRRRPPA